MSDTAARNSSDSNDDATSILLQIKRRLLAFFRFRLPGFNEDDLDDLIQLTFLKCIPYLMKIPKDAWGGYVYKSAPHAIADYFRMKGKLKTVNLTEEVWNSLTLMNENGGGLTLPQSIRLEQSIDELQEPHRTILRLFYYEGLSGKEIADQLEISNASGDDGKTALNYVQTAREMLSRMLASDNLFSETQEYIS